MAPNSWATTPPGRRAPTSSALHVLAARELVQTGAVAQQRAAEALGEKRRVAQVMAV